MSSLDTVRARRDLRALLLGIVLAAGAAYAHLLALIHGHIADADAEAWTCGGGALFDCSGNLASRFSVLFGLPISGYAAAWFLFMLAVLAGGTIFGRGGTGLYRRMLYTSIPAISATLYYLFISVFVLRSLCTYCLGMYALVAAIVMLAAAGAGIDWARVRRLALVGTRAGAVWAVPALVFAAAIAAERRFVASERDAANPQIQASLTTIPRLGPRDAVMKIVLFSEFECPACRVAAKEMDKFMARHPAEVELQLVPVPIHRKRDADAAAAGPLSEYLGPALGAAMHDRGLFWDFYKGVYLSERPVDPRLLWEVASRVAGPQEIPNITRELESPALRDTLKRYGAIAETNKATRIPAYVINGEFSIGVMKVEALEAKLDELRKGSRPEIVAASPGKATVRGN